MAIMTIAKLHCYQCNHDFPLNMYQPITKISCPYCDTDVDESMIEPIRDAWSQVSGLNQAFHKHEMESEEPRFSLNIHDEEVHLEIDDIDNETE
ncbi:hypothetical protein [Lactiplantibacillus plantarum]|uniref:hypothetical protein n=1 Tax=Lactiplantibacillus plantarum TaxID=1590 RepID=UPI00082530C2|nr:hypothetical protein [Lactiplantibacillus plantarum]ATL77880.1 hypothetical protein CRG99_04405 [Lactiplantibacillus plantarum]MZU25351.1 hypothetical protein [Lactiplantibacillus plantarum]MZU56484.1 hypothetical protein [Lactiplantibacillus plantarum]MZU73234.1 hypothetical protein [Lactiplantibacillus plantarum]MZV21507.1 hypothetical protein [Lactiplantibacillus plantarum]